MIARFRNFIFKIMMQSAESEGTKDSDKHVKNQVIVKMLDQEKKPELDSMKKDESRKVSLSDPKIKQAVYEILDFYGYPPTSEGCLNKQEKIMHIFGLMSAIQSLQRDQILTNKSLELDSSVMAEFFCRNYYEKYGHHVIPTEEETQDPDVFKLLKVGMSEGKDEKSKQQEDSKLDKTRSKEES